MAAAELEEGVPPPRETSAKLKSGKRAFVDKKRAVTFSVVHRSQQDGEHGRSDAASAHVLVPKVTRWGFPDDGYDYEQHVKAMDGSGAFVDPSGRVSKVSLPAEALPSEETAGRELEAVTLNPALMDEDLRRALFEEADDVEELQEDFVLEAQAGDEEEAFDYDAHIANLMRLAERQAPDTADQDQDDEVETWVDEDDHSVGVDDHVVGTVDEEAFEAALGEYDSEDESEVEAPAAIQFDDDFFDAMLDEAIASKVETDQDTDDDLKARVLARVVEMTDETPEEVEAQLDRAFDRHLQARRQRDDALDCESVLSTLSNLDNRPQRLLPPPRKPRLHLPDVVPEGDDHFGVDDDDNRLLGEEKHPVPDILDPEIVAPKTKRNEAKDDKKRRKALVKEHQRLARERKKESKLAWAAAAGRARATGAGGPSVYSLS